MVTAAGQLRQQSVQRTSALLQEDTAVADVAGNSAQASNATTGIAMLPDRAKHRPKRFEQASPRTAWCEPRKNRTVAQPGWFRDPKQAGREDSEYQGFTSGEAAGSRDAAM